MSNYEPQKHSQICNVTKTCVDTAKMLFKKLLNRNVSEIRLMYHV